jgi:hypothetical protein
VCVYGKMDNKGNYVTKEAQTKGKVKPIGHLPFRLLRITLIGNYVQGIYNIYL